MKDWQGRVVEEGSKLTKRLQRLQRFLTSSSHLIDGAEHERLVRQQAAMSAYLAVLNERVEAFR